MTLITEDVVTVVPAPPAPEDEGPARKSRSRAMDGLSSLSWAGLGAAVIVGLWQLAAWRSPDLPTPTEGFSELWKLK